MRRRHLATRGRAVTGVEDEALDLDSLDAGARSSLTGEGALLAHSGSMIAAIASIVDGSVFPITKAQARPAITAR